MADRILLRFRDFNANTIAEHEKIISRTGYSWWGWWKKSDEPHRTRELESLKTQLATGDVEVGLFDGSKASFYKAYVSDCVFGENSERTSSPSPRATPPYYRKEKLSAWFRVTRIEALSIDGPEFKRLFRSVPVGNETFFSASDPRDAAKEQNPRPDLARTAIRVSATQILHLSDIHFGEYAFPASARPGEYPLDGILVDDLKRLDAKIGILVVSGDLTTRADANRLFSEALPFLQKLTVALGLTPEQVVIVPGNHDIPLRDHDPVTYKHEDAYLTFMKEFYGQKVEVMGLRRYELDGGQHIEILTMNSVRLRSVNQKQYGYVQWPLYESLLASAPGVPSTTVRIAVLHHHLAPATNEEAIDPEYPDAGMSMTLDSGSIIEGLQRYGFQLALNGHQHVPKFTKVARGRVQDDSFELAGLDVPLNILGGGSVGTSRLFPEMRDNTYNLLTIINDTSTPRISIRVRRFNSGSQPRDHIRHELCL
jgi:predicted MPP superfamily phosphohydrolase